MLVRRFQPEEWVEIARGQRRKPRRHSAIAELEIILELPINSLLHSNPKQGRRPTTGTSQSSSQANRRGAGPQARLSFTQDCRKHTPRSITLASLVSQESDPVRITCTSGFAPGSEISISSTFPLFRSPKLLGSCVPE